MSKKVLNTRSPCIGVCILEPHWGSFCVGCKRMTLEIQNWIYYSDEEKDQINRRIEDLSLEDRNDYPKY